jgi:hypothetical protein
VPIVREGDEFKPVVRLPEAFLEDMQVRVNSITSTTVTLTISNFGAASISASAPISFYDGGNNGLPLSAATFITMLPVGIDVFKGETVTQTYNLTGNFNDRLIWARIMDNNRSFPAIGAEDCDTSNNTASGADCPYLLVKLTTDQSQVCQTGNVRISVTDMSGDPFQFQHTPVFRWYKDNVLMASETDSFINITTGGNAYFCWVEDGICRKRTQTDTVYIPNCPGSTYFTVNATHHDSLNGKMVCHAGNRTFSATLWRPDTATAGFLKWFINDVEQTGKADSLTWDTTLAVGTYTVRMDARLRDVMFGLSAAWHSYTTTFEVGESTAITLHPSSNEPSLCLNAGDFPVLSVSAKGLNPTYQWYRNTTNSTTGGTLIGGATDTFYAPASSLPPGNYYYYCVASGDCGKDTSNASGVHTVRSTCEKRVNITVFLQGALAPAGDTMTTYIQRGGYLFTHPSLPNTDRYGMSYSQINNPTLANKVVDWVRVEIWGEVNKTTLKYVLLDSQSLLLRPNGSIVDTNGNYPRLLLPSDSMHIVVKHRNHLAVMSYSISNLTKDTVDYDFTTAGAYQHNTTDPDPMVRKNARWCMWAGDIDDNGLIDAADMSTVITDFKAGGNVVDTYRPTDVTHDGVVDATDTRIVQQNVRKNCVSPVGYFRANP